MASTTVAGAVPGLVPDSERLVVEGVAYAKVTWRLLPFLFACYVFAYLDRVNVGFAKLQMLSDLKFSETVYGLGAGIFFIGYFLFEVPSNLIMYRVGARVWIGRAEPRHQPRHCQRGKARLQPQGASQPRCPGLHRRHPRFRQSIPRKPGLL